MVDLTGKTALITGAGQGVGRGIALAMSKAGANVVLAGRTLGKVEDAVDEITARGGRAYAVACDVKSAADMKAAIDASMAALMVPE